MISRDLLVKRAQARSSLLYGFAPRRKNSRLSNLGSVALADGVLKNGAQLVSGGPLKGGAGVLLDDTKSQYLDTGWLTRTNLVTNPTLATALTGWSGNGAGVIERIATLPSLGGLPGGVETGVKITSSAGSDGGRIATIACQSGVTYRFSGYVKKTVGAAPVVFRAANVAGAAIVNKEVTAAEAAEWIRLDVSFTASETGNHQIRLIQGAGGTEQVMYGTGFLAEASGELGSFFPRPADLISGHAGWSGTENASASDIGPWARGVARTIVVAANRLTGGGFDEFLGGSLAPPYFGLGNGTVAVAFSADGAENDLWTNVWPYETDVVGTLVFDDIANTVGFGVDGLPLSTTAHTAAFKGQAAGGLVIGVGGGLTSYLRGTIGAVLVFGEALTEAEYRELFAPSRAVKIAQPVDDRLFVKLIDAHGHKSRLGPDEPDAAGIPAGITTANAAPGGHRDAGFTLLRDPRRSWPDLNLIDQLEIYGRSRPLGRSAFEGQGQHFPSDLSDTLGITFNGVGNQVQLGEDESFQALYVALGFNDWEDSPLSRRENLANAGLSQGKIAASSSDGGLVWDPPAENLAVNELTELEYQAPAGIRVAKMDYRGTQKGTWTKFEAPKLYGGDNQALTLPVSLEALSLTLDNTIRSVAFATARRYLMLRACVIEALSPNPAGVQQSYDRLALYGDHGLTLREIEGNTNPRGVYPHDVLAHMISTGAPGLTYTVGGDGTIVPNTSFVIPHLAFLTRGKVSEAIEKLNAYFLNNWAVWDKKRFYWHPWDPARLTWEASIAGGAHWTPAGFQAETLLNGLIVNYTDVAGVSRTAGPIGSGCDYESALLEDSDPNNPYTRNGRRRWGKLDVGFPLAYSSTAIQIGHAVMLESTVPQRSGTLVIRPRGIGHVPEVKHPTAGRMPIWAVRSGEYMRLRGWPDPEPFRIVEADYAHDTKTLTLQLDSGSGRVSAILERGGSRLSV